MGQFKYLDDAELAQRGRSCEAYIIKLQAKLIGQKMRLEYIRDEQKERKAKKHIGFKT